MASLKEVAQLAAVSLMTVSRAINEPQRLKPETLARVQTAISALNYVPDFSARKMRGRSTKVSTLGVLALDTATTPFSVELLLSIELTAREFGWSSFLVNITSQEDSKRAVSQLLSQRPDGIIFTTMGLREVEIPERLLDKNLVLANCLSREHAKWRKRCESQQKSFHSAVTSPKSGQFVNPGRPLATRCKIR